VSESVLAPTDDEMVCPRCGRPSRFVDIVLFMSHVGVLQYSCPEDGEFEIYSVRRSAGHCSVSP
jgi:hypothetical protein